MIRKLLLLLILPVFVMGQSHPESLGAGPKLLGAGLDKEVEVGTFLSTSGQNPFWLRSNQYGIMPLESQGITVRARIGTEQSSLNPSNRFSRKDSLDRSLNWKGFKFDYAVEAVINVGQVGQFLLPEAYAAVKWKVFELYVGRRREIVGLVDTTLTSGSYIWSGNALPMPKIQLSIPEFTPILGKGLVSIKGAYAHGWFDNDRPFTSNVKLHQKWLYGRLGRPDWKAKFYGGFNHQAQWGGNSPFFTVNGKLPDGFKNYLYVVSGKRGAIRGVIETKSFDANRVGNHLGSIDLGMSIVLNRTTLFIYRQSFYEDGSLFFLNNITDGLTGVSIKLQNPYISKVTFEYLDTRSQGGNTFLLFSNDNSQIPDELRGSDSYFSNGQFVEGYTYKNRIIGTPFIQKESLNWRSGQYRSDLFQENNRVKLVNIAFNGEISSYQYSTHLSFSNNLGTYNSPINKTQFSGLLNLGKQIKLSKFNPLLRASLAVDSNGIYPFTLGAFVSLTQTF
ncbi:MAG: hypothetical protein ACI9V1_000431 [Spirosomataceae bacterium]|jgi:hypothetical protein